ncbi:hypothetical protein I4100191B2_27320 [Clostridiales bacterium]
MSRKPDSPVLSSTKFYFAERNAKQLGALPVAVIHMEKTAGEKSPLPWHPPESHGTWDSGFFMVTARSTA